MTASNEALLRYTPGAAPRLELSSAGLEAASDGGARVPTETSDSSTFDPATAYVAVSFHLMDDRKPFIYQTNDFGATWSKINGNIPSGHPLDYVLSLSGNPNRKGMLFAGTGHGFYYTLDDGGTWTQFKTGLPPAPVTWITEPGWSPMFRPARCPAASGA